MHADRENRYRPLLEEDPPEFANVVGSPFASAPDLEEYNSAASRKIANLLRQLERRRVKPKDEWRSDGLLILGDPGTGKTHTLMRAARTLGRSNRILFVPKPTNRDTVAQHIWRNVVESLARTLPGGDRCQLDDLLAHVFRDVLAPVLERDIELGRDADRKRRWVQRLQADPYSLFTMLGDGEQRQKNFEALRTRTLNAVKSAHPEVDPTVTRALITYCLTAENARKRQLLDWLRGIELHTDDAKQLGLPPLFTPLDPSADDDSVGRSREDQAQRAIVSVARLSTHYQPLFLAFDELEGLRGDRELTAAWGNVVRYLFTYAPNMLIVTCVFPSLWREWFEPLVRADFNVRSLADRMAGEGVVELEPFSAKYGLGLIAGCMAASFERHRLPSNVYPFEPADIEEIGRRATTAREFIREAKLHFFEPWAENAAPLPPPPPPEQVTQEQIEQVVVAELTARYAEGKAKKTAWTTDDQDFLARLEHVLKAALAHSGEEATFEKLAGRGVMPPSFVVRSAGVAPAVVAAVAVSHAEGNSLAASVKNLLTALEAGKHVPGTVLMRYQACSDAVGVTAANLQKFATGRGQYLRTVREDVALVNAVYDVLSAVEEGDLAVGRSTVTKPQFVRALRAWGPAKQSQIVRQIAVRFPPLRRALGLQEPAATPRP